MSVRFGRVLIVDDERSVREVLRDYLTDMGDEVATAASGAEALEIVLTFRPHVILTDMVMPGMSGADLLGALRGAGVTVPVILISGHPIDMPEGFFRLLYKPFDLRKLAEVVTAAMDLGKT
jgi:DNA-binding NtrC family response regulator